MTDERDHKGFAEAVERKKRESKEASEQPEQTPAGSPVEGDQNEMPSPRTSGTQHKKVTADKWNQ
jgi:hypothetical protein